MLRPSPWSRQSATSCPRFWKPRPKASSSSSTSTSRCSSRAPIENIHRNQTLGKPLTIAILDGSNEVIQPLTVATLAICIVFFPVLLLTGPSRFLFIPLAITVVLAMLASYLLSFTVVPAQTHKQHKDHD